MHGLPDSAGIGFGHLLTLTGWYSVIIKTSDSDSEGGSALGMVELNVLRCTDVCVSPSVHSIGGEHGKV